MRERYASYRRSQRSRSEDGCLAPDKAAIEALRTELARPLEEARAIADMGLRSIDLVTGEVPQGPFVDRIARAVEAILRDTPIQRVHLNVGALSQSQYRTLRATGAAGIHLYQETYDPVVYRAVHRSGPKRDLAWRLEAPERAIDAGFPYIGMGRAAAGSEQFRIGDERSPAEVAAAVERAGLEPVF